MLNNAVLVEMLVHSYSQDTWAPVPQPSVWLLTWLMLMTPPWPVSQLSLKLFASLGSSSDLYAALLEQDSPKQSPTGVFLQRLWWAVLAMYGPCHEDLSAELVSSPAGGQIPGRTPRNQKLCRFKSKAIGNDQQPPYPWLSKGLGNE